MTRDDELITPTDLAKRWKIDVKTLSNWRVAGRGPAYLKLGAGKHTKVLYRAADVEAFEQAGLRQPAREATR